MGSVDDRDDAQQPEQAGEEQTQDRPATTPEQDPDQVQRQGLAQPGPPTDPQHPTG
ncbi:hypothetical protein [Nocardioides solisilvae]|uniref:hypothetical protein n=1 Tax=Nocardioides solisilvae TaxID=1542435 RepID=UPI0013A5887E|nr:hypothetical protein [Nocardioides solisilvae]